MKMTSALLRTPVLVGVLVSCSGLVMAGEVEKENMDLDNLAVLETDNMEQHRGRENTSALLELGGSGNDFDLAMSNQNLSSSVSDNSINVDTLNSGGISIESNAFDGFRGVGVFNMLTGVNNAVDAAVGVSVNISNTPAN